MKPSWQMHVAAITERQAGLKSDLVACLERFPPSHAQLPLLHVISLTKP